MAKKETLDDSNGSNIEGSQEEEDDYEEDEFEQEYRERRKAYDKLEDIEQLKESIRRVTGPGQSKVNGGHEAARDNRISGQKNRFAAAHDEEDEAMIEESFSVGGSEIDDENFSVN